MRRFFDTNILVYSRDPGDRAKRDIARALVEEAIAADAFVISTQVLVEFYATCVRRNLLGPEQALRLVRLWSEHDAVPQTPDLVVRGIALHQSHSLSMWDALIVQAALDARCGILLSEDLQHGRRFGELEVANPFGASAGAHERLAPTYAARGKKRPSRPRQPRPVA